MTWMWDDNERLNKFIRSIQKWMEFQLNENDTITEEVAEQAFYKAKTNSYEIIEKFNIQDETTAGFLQSWVELGIFSGYLTGWKDSDKVIENNSSLTRGNFFLRNGDFFVTEKINESAKKYALEVTDETFNRLLRKPVSPLIEGLDEKFIRLLKVCHESSLYAGFLSGVEDAFSVKARAIDPFDLESVFS